MTDSGPAALQAQSSSRKEVFTTITLAVGFLAFMAFLAGIIFTNAMITDRSSQTLTDINLASRQSTLVERIAKDLVQIQSAMHARRSAANEAQELSDSANVFNATERAFENGGRTQYISGQNVSVDELAEPSQRRLLDQTNEYWVPLRARLAVLAQDPASQQSLDAATAMALAASPHIADFMDGLSADMGKTAADNIEWLTYIRFLLIGFAVLTIIIIVGSLFMRVTEGHKQHLVDSENLRRRNDEIEESSRHLAEAKAGTDLIMDTVTQGLFLIDAKYKIQGQYSRELEQIFRLPELAGYNFVNILQRLLTERMFNTSRDYLALLFDKTKKERTVLKVNPLDEVEVNFANPEGGFISKFLSFSFRRIVENGEISRVFIAVSDVTDRVQLERQLRESEQRKERQFEFLLGILHVDPVQLDDFLKTAKEQVAAMNDALRAQDFATATSGQMDMLRQRLDIVYRSVHNIKGNAAMLRLQYFQKICDQFEARIVDLKNRSALGGDDFLSVVIAQSELRQDLDELQELREKFVGVGKLSSLMPELAAAHPEIGGPIDDLVGSISSLASQVGMKQGKEVRVDAAGFDSRVLPDEKRRIVKDVLIQLTRNSMAHGIEDGRLREALGKQRAATITIRRIEGPENSFGFTFRDDGRGLDPTRIRESAVAKGLISPEAGASMSDGDIVGLIFQPGFSTADEATTDAGRGMGMNVIKEAIVDKCGGEIGVNSEPGQFAEFTFVIPLTPQLESGTQAPEYAHN
jgi:two-component system chemotaxis sensor kinase CheA